MVDPLVGTVRGAEPPHNSSPFDKRTLRQRCSLYIRDLIVSGQAQPGEHLIETKLAAELGVSRSTLRESFRPLEVEGLLVDDGRGHMLVRALTSDEIRDVFEVRAALECLAAARLARRTDRDAVAAELRDSLTPLLDDRIDFSTQLSVDLGFHELLCRLTGNATLLRSWQQLIGPIEMMIIAVGQELAATRMRYADHIVIVDAISAGDVARTAEVVTEHMNVFATKYLRDQRENPTR